MAWRKLAAASMMIAIGLAAPAATAVEEPTSEARSFPYDDGVVDLLVIGPAARTLYDRLPGRGVESECGGSGLRKGDGSMTCVKDGAEYSCHIWLDARKQTLAPPETDDC